MNWSDLAWWLFVLFFIIQLVRLAMADADLTLMWVERFGKRADSLCGKVVWITGASSGIGEYLAYELAKGKCKLILSARRVPELERVKKQCLLHSSTTEDDIFVLPFDQNDLDSHKQKFQDALQKFGKIDILVNNAGRGQMAKVDETDLDVDKAIMNLNYFGVLSLTKQVLPYMLQRNEGHIVVTSSLLGIYALPALSSYSGSKYALQGWFNALRLEVAQKPITVSMVCPGPVSSSFTQQCLTNNMDRTYCVNENANTTNMDTARCAELMAVAIANRLDEVWIARNPILLFTYLNQYLPNQFRWFLKQVAPTIMQKIKNGEGI